MTKAKAATVASALINAGYSVTIAIKADGSYVVAASGDGVDPAAIAAFASNNAVTAAVSTAYFS